MRMEYLTPVGTKRTLCCAYTNGQIKSYMNQIISDRQPTFIEAKRRQQKFPMLLFLTDFTAEDLLLTSQHLEHSLFT